jgi:vitamin B12 transporter
VDEELSAEEPVGDEPAAHQVGDVVVTATRTDTPAAQVASSVTVVTAEEIERRQLRLVTDVLRRVPGVDVRRNGGPGSVTSIFMRGGDSDHVLVLLDGVELNDPSSPSRAPTLNDLTTEDIERIEVVRGPQSVLYGGDAMSGVIQIITKRGSGKPRVVGSGEGGSYSTARGVVSVSGATGSLNYAVSGSYWSTDGFSANSSGFERDSYENGTTSARGGWKLNDQFSLDGMLRYSNAKVEYDASPTVEHDHHIDTEQWLARFAPRLSLFDGRWVQTLSGQFSRNERDTKATSFLKPGVPSFHTQIDGNLYALDWQNELRLIKGHLVTLGLEQQWEEADFVRQDFDTFEFKAFDDSRDNFAVYLQDQITWGERLFGTAGFRYDNSSDFESEVTYRFTAGVSVPEIHTIFRTSYGTGYKAPSLAELNLNSFAPNPNLDPEKSKGGDVGFETSLYDGRFVTTATFFYNDVDDLIITFDQDPEYAHRGQGKSQRFRDFGRLSIAAAANPQGVDRSDLGFPRQPRPVRREHSLCRRSQGFDPVRHANHRRLRDPESHGSLQGHRVAHGLRARRQRLGRKLRGRVQLRNRGHFGLRGHSPRVLNPRSKGVCDAGKGGAFVERREGQRDGAPGVARRRALRGRRAADVGGRGVQADQSPRREGRAARHAGRIDRAPARQALPAVAWGSSVHE